MKHTPSAALRTPSTGKHRASGQKPPAFPPKKRWVVLSLCLLLVIALSLAFILPPVLRGKVIMTSGTYRLREGVFCFLYSYFRYRIPASSHYKEQGVQDTAAFWDRIRPDGTTEGEYYGELAIRMIRETLAAASLFDKYGSMSASDRTAIKEAEEAVLSYSYKGGGSKEVFNERAAVMGFTWRDFCDGTLLLWKAEHARQALYGTNGSSVSAEEAQHYLTDNYIATKIIFVRTENRFVIEEATGNRVPDENGGYETRPLTQKEHEETQKRLTAVRDALQNGLAAEEAFDALYLDYSEPTAAYGLSETHYFTRTDAAATSAYTAAFAQDFPTVLAAAQALEGPLQYTELFVPGLGYFFLLNATVNPSAYTDKTLSECFDDDFGNNVSISLFSKRLAEATDRIKVRAEEWIAELDFPSAIPNKNLYAIIQ